MNARNGTLLRVFVAESGRAGKQPLYAAVVEELRAAGIGGATVLKAIEGFGPHRHVRSARTVDFGGDLPVVVEAIAETPAIEAVIPRLREIVREGLLTVQQLEFLTLEGES